MEPAKPDELSQEERAGLIAAAFQAKEKAYCRYSNFHVGAALLANNGTIIQGANIENASYGATICAERTALVKAVSEGINRFRGLAVVTDIPGPCSPCGVCRQFLREFCQKTMPVLLTVSMAKARS
ncbi:hypothetical protein FRB99_006142 [Tulasnella sp. 403]|nr:hypothetical protein FRB99_006142 [Tulasnella sp. 403]